MNCCVFLKSVRQKLCELPISELPRLKPSKLQQNLSDTFFSITKILLENYNIFGKLWECLILTGIFFACLVIIIIIIITCFFYLFVFKLSKAFFLQNETASVPKDVPCVCIYSKTSTLTNLQEHRLMFSPWFKCTFQGFLHSQSGIVDYFVLLIIGVSNFSQQ